jgi:hypothetical protein
MRNLIRVASVLGALVLSAYGANPGPKTDKEKASDQTLIVITFKDGHQESYAMADIARVEYKGADDSTVGPEQFLGKWEAGTGSGAGTFFITLESNGEASKTLGANHGTWAIVGEEVQISWDDGWRDVIRKTGKKQYEKRAFMPGVSFSDGPENVTEAWRIKKFKP